jgi:hypothetical protein
MGLSGVGFNSWVFLTGIEPQTSVSRDCSVSLIRLSGSWDFGLYNELSEYLIITIELMSVEMEFQLLIGVRRFESYCEFVAENTFLPYNNSSADVSTKDIQRKVACFLTAIDFFS